MNNARFIIITGMSGAGKSLVLRALEDMDYFCIDNLPPTLIPKFAELYQHLEGNVKNVALVVDIRVGSFFKQFTRVLEDLTKQGFAYDLLFLDCSDEVLIQRYKETRRKHPLAAEDRISNGLRLERELLGSVKSVATHIINTSFMTSGDLKAKITEMFCAQSPKASFSILLLTFGFKYGVPTDIDMLFDVRFLQNPFYIESLRALSGNEKEVGEYILSSPIAKEFLEKLYEMMDFLIPLFIKEGKPQLIIAFGCTGGMHRSVFVANMLAEYLKTQGYNVRKEHRDIPKNQEA